MSAETVATEPSVDANLAVASRLEWIDEWMERGSWLVNPILIKEARQALKSRQFVFSFGLLLVAAWAWSICGVLLMNPAIMFLPSGRSMLIGYYFVLAVPLLAVVPLAAHRSLASEIDDGTFELLAVTTLSPLQIVTGKLASAGLQAMVYFSALVPCLAFTYLLRGIDLITIAMVFGAVFSAAALLTSVGLFLATLASGRAGQVFMLLCLVLLVALGEFICGMFVFFYISQPFPVTEPEVLFSITGLVAGGLSFIVLAILAAASAIAPVSENRSTKLRLVMFVQQALWVGFLSYPILLTGYDEVAYTTVFPIAIYWLLMGTLMQGEAPVLSPRVRRSLPKSFLGRMFLTWFNPGAGTGFVFVSIQATIGCLAVGILFQVHGDTLRTQDVWDLIMLLLGYLLFYLGATRLLMQLLSRFARPTFGVAAAVCILLMSMGALIPFGIVSIIYRNSRVTYDLSQLTNWAWTLSEWEGGGLPFGLPVLVVSMGAVVAFLNLLTLGREVTTRRVLKPKRVQQDEADQVSESLMPVDPLA